MGIWEDALERGQQAAEAEARKAEKRAPLTDENGGGRGSSLKFAILGLIGVFALPLVGAAIWAQVNPEAFAQFQAATDRLEENRLDERETDQGSATAQLAEAETPVEPSVERDAWRVSMTSAVNLCVDAEERYLAQIDSLFETPAGSFSGSSAQASIDACNVAKRQVVAATIGKMATLAGPAGACIVAVSKRRDAAEALRSFARGDGAARSDASKLESEFAKEIQKCRKAIIEGSI